VSKGHRLPYPLMRRFADHLWQYLAGAVRMHDVAGSVRRFAAYPSLPPGADCGDLELVLDGDRETVYRKLRAKPNAFRHISGGERLLKFQWHHPVAGREVVIDVQLNFATTLHTLEWGTVNNYGWKLLLATGDAAWNRLLVLDRRYGGLKPCTVQFLEGRTSGFIHLADTPQHTPTERDVFDLYGLPYVAPHRRNEVTVRELRVALAEQRVL
jgi:hypothetical protein